ncbi:MAG: GNAT family N-acetyltransferase [Opitutus sp.]|nr:GNAT family N-acetyltransferase [Opitutus sp.]MCS6246380.1 GNAT family N-acetyltransferase [Opitutus sp.]MCS6273238.1 GNAT family N-acetyltransferase [Opitutus sp.]MCS6277985.1 GNAT family N-acetyltransferase [Opitutus sp.]MCS6298907.1 GNAT family N-acetyltransferase [Opitutus sp.]
MNLRPLIRDDLPAIAAVHQAAFPRTVASRLGTEASRRQYETLMTGPYNSAGLGAFEQDRLAGFCFVGIRHASEYVFVRKHAWFFVWRLCSRPWLLVDAVISRRLGLALKLFVARLPWPRTKQTAGAGVSEPATHSYGIQYLAVAPLYRGRGVGQKLVAAGEGFALQQGFSEIQLSVATDNAPAIALYLRMGWQKSSSSGEWLGLMSKRLVA